MNYTILVIIVIVALIILGAWAAVDGANKRIDLFHSPSLITPVPELIISNRPKYFMKRIDNDEVVAVYNIDKNPYMTSVLVYRADSEDFPPSWRWEKISQYRPIN